VTSHDKPAVPAAYFDVDGTLLSTNLLQPTFFYLANQATPARSLSSLARAAWKAPAMIAAELTDRRTFNELLYSTFEGITQDRLFGLADEAFDAVMRSAVLPHARGLIDRHKSQGHEVVLVSGALDFLMSRLATHFGADTVIANKLDMRDGRATGGLLRPIVAGPEKSRLIREHAKSKGHDLGDCFGYSDSYSDVPMLSVVGHPAAVNPDLRLRQLARAYHWPILDLTDRTPLRAIAKSLQGAAAAKLARAVSNGSNGAGS
jgi:HAD superfamily hydrolase (TIGR01490 family)